MKKPKKEKHFINKPAYPGGPKALWAFIRKNLQYPKEALKNKISGVVRLRYTISDKGIVTSTQIIHSLGHGCDEEAIRVIGLLKYNVPKHRKLRIKFTKTINVKFYPPKEKKIKVTLSKKKEKPAQKLIKKKKSGYEYTISV